MCQAQADREAEFNTDSLPDRIINPGEYVWSNATSCSRTFSCWAQRYQRIRDKTNSCVHLQIN